MIKILKAVRVRFEWLEIFWIILGVLFVFEVLRSPSPSEDNFIPNAVTGLTTMLGILTGFIGFLLNYTYSNLKDNEIKKWLSKRIKAIVFVVCVGLTFAFGSFSDLVYGRLESAYKTASIGAGIIFLAFAEIMYVIAFKRGI